MFVESGDDQIGRIGMAVILPEYHDHLGAAHFFGDSTVNLRRPLPLIVAVDVPKMMQVAVRVVGLDGFKRGCRGFELVNRRLVMVGHDHEVPARFRCRGRLICLP